MNILAQSFVPELMVDAVRERLGKFVKRFTKMGLPIPELSLTGNVELHRTCETQDIGCNYVTNYHSIHCAIDKWVEVIISGDEPKYDGWSLVASVDNVNGKPVFRTVPGNTIPDRFKSIDPSYCEHCNIDRYRNETHIVRHEDGRYLQMGSTCIKDYLGWDISSVLTFFRFIDSAFDADEYGGYGGYSRPAYDINTVIRVAADVVSVDGRYFPSSFQQDATASKVRDIIMVPDGKPQWWTDLVRKYSSQPEQAQRIYDETLDAWNSLSAADIDKNEWLYNISVIKSADTITLKHVGILASIVCLGLRRVEDKVNAQSSKSEHVGNVGDKIDTTVTIDDIKYVDSDWGGSFLLTMHDANGNQFKWFASNISRPSHAYDGLTDMEYWTGKSVRIRGTIKKHDEFKGKKSTVLTRCKMEVIK